MLDAKTGKELNDVDADVPPTVPPVLAASPMTYMVGGKQYISLAATGVLVTYTLGAQEKQPPPAEKEQQQAVLPDAPGKDTFLQVCSGCHSPQNVVGKGFNEDGWTQVVGSMVDHGAQISDAQFATIVKYLVTAFPPIPIKINVNQVSADELQSRLGITAGEAQSIVTYRQQNGNFKSVDDLKQVPGLDFSKIEAKKNLLTF